MSLSVRFGASCWMVVLLCACGGGSSPGPGSGSSPPVAGHLESDPYPTTDTQPDHFIVACDGAAPVDSAPAVNKSGSRYLYFSLSGFGPGLHTCTLAAADASGAQSNPESVSFAL